MDFNLVFDVGDVGGRAGGHVVEDRDLVALGKECITEVRTDKTGSTGDENAHGVKSIGAKSATTLVLDSGLSDVLATGLIVAGEDGAGWFAQHELVDYLAWVIDRHTGGVWGVGARVISE